MRRKTINRQQLQLILCNRISQPELTAQTRQELQHLLTEMLLQADGEDTQELKEASDEVER